jgi:hypothetical protein
VVFLLAPTASKKKAPRLSVGEVEIFVNRLVGLLGDLEPDRTAGFLLAHRRALHGVAKGCDILDLQAHHVATAQLAIDGEIE